jgi:hypothetical protein
MIYNSPGIKRWKAHITLKSEEDYIIEEEALKNILMEMVQTVHPIPLQVHTIQIHDDPENHWNIYLSVEGEILPVLTRKISKRFEKFVDTASPRSLQGTYWEQSNDYYPHMSIIDGHGMKEGKKLLHCIQQEAISLPRRIVCRSITLAQWEDTHWRKIITHDLT